MPPPAVELDGVTLRQGERTVLQDVRARIETGEFIGLIGPNGSGKTTLLRAILGLVRPSAGAIRVLGGAPARGNRLAGYLPQDRGALADLRMSGRALLASAWRGERPGLPRPGAGGRREIERALETVAAGELAERPVCELSGGELQRLLLAQTLLDAPRLLLLDEPFISLDPRHQQTVVELVQGVRERLGVTVLLSAHELNPLLPAVSRVLYLARGRAVIGTVDEVVTGPVLSRLYGTEIEVLRPRGRVFVMAGSGEVGPDAHHHHP